MASLHPSHLFGCAYWLVLIYDFFDKYRKKFYLKKPSKYTESVLEWHKSRAQITTINKIGERKTSIKSNWVRLIKKGKKKKKKPWNLD